MKNKRAIFLVFLANTISGIAQGISIISIPWYLINIVELGDFWAKAYMFITLCIIPASLIFGTFIDRYSRGKIMSVISFTGMVFLGIVSLLGYQDQHIPALVVAAVFMYTFLHYNIHYPNLYAFIQEISDEQHYKKLNSWIEIQGQVTTAISGAIGAILLEGVNGELNLLGFIFPVDFTIAPWPLYKIFAMDATSYFLAFLLFSQLKFESTIQRNIDKGNILNRLSGGYKFLSQNKSLFLFGIASFALFACVLVFIFYVLPSYISSYLGQSAKVFASAQMFFALGSLVAGFFANRLFKHYHPIHAIIILSIVSIISYLVCFYNQLLVLFYLSVCFIGFCNAGTRVIRISYLYTKIPNDFFGRAGSIFNVANVITRFSLILLLSQAFFQNGFNIRFSMLVFGMVIFSSAFVLIGTYKPLTSGDEIKKPN